jgi:alcohol dehydrogenase (cytochrome c)
MSSRTRWFAAAVVLSLVLAGLVPFVTDPESVRVRVKVVALKLRGGLDDLSWPELIKMLGSGNRGRVRALVNVGTPFGVINNPFSAEVAAGGDLFRAQCAACHGPNGDGTGGKAPDLTTGQFRRGQTDWGLFRTISRGIPGTSMSGKALPERQLWQIVAFVRSISAGGEPAVSDRPPTVVSPVTNERLRQAASEPGNWLMYSGTFDGTRHSALDEINRQTVGALRLKWVYQLASGDDPVEATPLVVDGIMYVTEPPSSVLALDAATGRLLWKYQRTLLGAVRQCCWNTNQGVAVFGTRVYVGTLDAHLVALDGATGKVAWDVEVAKPVDGYSIKSAPLAVNDKIVIGVAGGEFGVRGFVDAYDSHTGNRVWRFHTTPGPGEPGHETWVGDSWRTGGGPTWLVGSFDPELNLLYWGVGNPAPAFGGVNRQGDNLYTESVVALDLATGGLRWYFQFTPHDEHDWDANQIPVLVDRTIAGVKRKLMLWANRNGFFYVLDRETGQFLHAQPFVKQTWAKGLTPEGRPILASEPATSPRGTLVWPGHGATNFWSPSYSPITDLYYVHAHERPSIYVSGSAAAPAAGAFFENGKAEAAAGGTGAILALRPETGDQAWTYALEAGAVLTFSHGGLLSTRGNVVFGGSGEGRFVALDAQTGKELWRTELGSAIFAAPITFRSDGTQLLTIAAGRNLFTFELPLTAASHRPK